MLSYGSIEEKTNYEMLYGLVCFSGNFGSEIAIALSKFQNLGDFIYIWFTLVFFQQHG